MAVRLDDPALGLACEARPHEQLALLMGLNNLADRVGFQPTTDGLVIRSSIP